VIIPMTTAVVLSYGVRKALCRDSIYTLKLVRRGHYMPEAMQTNFHHLRQARDVMNTSVMTLPSASTLEDLARLAAAHRTMPYFVVVEGNRVVGVIGREAAWRAREPCTTQSTVGAEMSQDYILIAEQTTLFDLIAAMRANNAAVAVVVPSTEAVTAADVQ